MNYLIIFISIIACLALFIFSKSRKKSKKKIKTFLSNLQIPKFNVSFHKYAKNKVYFKYINKINNEDQYLTWRYTGKDHTNKNKYNLVLLPYKNKQNEFIIHHGDSVFLAPFYLKYNLVNPEIINQLSNLLFITSEYNVNKDQYLELEKYDENTFIIKASLWLQVGPNAYLHIDDRNKLYFENGISDNITKFIIT